MEEEKYKKGWERYECLRRLNPHEFKELWLKCLREDARFDDAVDEEIKKYEERKLK